MSDMMKLGPKEMKGTIWDEKGHSRITHIYISHQKDGINSFKFSDFGDDGEVFSSDTYGETIGMKFDTVTIDYPDEYLVSLSGEYDDGKLISIVFGTNKRKYGPYGMNRGSGTMKMVAYDEFNFTFGPRNCFGGFHGSVYDGSVYAIGVYVKPYELYNLYDIIEKLNNDDYYL